MPKCQECHRVILETIMILQHLFLDEVSLTTMQKCKKCKGTTRKNNIRQREKDRIFVVRARYLLRFSKGFIFSRWSVNVFIVTKVIAMKKDNEKKWIARVCFGRSFIPKVTAETAATAVTALCFSHCPKMEFREESKFMSMYYR